MLDNFHSWDTSRNIERIIEKSNPYQFWKSCPENNFRFFPIRFRYRSNHRLSYLRSTDDGSDILKHHAYTSVLNGAGGGAASSGRENHQTSGGVGVPNTLVRGSTSFVSNNSQTLMYDDQSINFISSAGSFMPPPSTGARSPTSGCGNQMQQPQNQYQVMPRSQVRKT